MNRSKPNVFIFEPLERRLLLSADALPISVAPGAMQIAGDQLSAPLFDAAEYTTDGGTAAEAVASANALQDGAVTAASSVAENNTSDIVGESATADASETTSTKELIVINSNVYEFDQLISGLEDADSTDRNFEVVILDTERDGIEQVTSALGEYSDLDAVHFITHGTDGMIKLGNCWLNDSNLQVYTDFIAAWGDSLSNNGDILFYGCNIAEGSDSKELLKTIAELTGADVAASDDITGHIDLGGDWVLEFAVGQVESSSPFNENISDTWHNGLAAFLVNTTADVVNGTDSFLSLREAIIAANISPGADEITLGSGIYTLTIGGVGEDGAATGDLDITSEMTITGMGVADTFINGGGLDRVFDIRSLGNLTISNVTISGGTTTDMGGGLLVNSGNQLTVNNSTISGNQAVQGGGIYNLGTSILTDVEFSNNIASATGGGIHNDRVATLNGVTISGNQADTGAGIYNSNSATNLLLTNATVSGNSAASTGGGLYARSPATIVNSTFTLNSSDTAGGIGTQGGGSIVDIQNTIIAGNTAFSSFPDVSGIFNSSGYNLIGDVTGTSNIVNGVNGDQAGTTGSPIDPLLGVLQDNGGPTFTHALLAGSPAIDTGNNTGAPAVDQRGYARLFDGDGDLTATVDIGAYEFVPDSLVNADYYLDGAGDESDVPMAALKTTAPVDMTLNNFDPGRDAFNGLLLARSSEGVNEDEATKYQQWNTTTGDIRLYGSASLSLWSAMKSFDEGKAGSINAYLVDSDITGGSLTVIASATISRDDWDVANTGSWIEDTFDFGTVDYTLAAGRYLGVKVVVNTDLAEDDMWLAYDVTTSPSRLTVTTETNAAPTGSVTIDNTTPAQGDTLTASNTLADADGLSGPISYQWQRDGVDLVGATGVTYTTTQADVGAAISVVASYTDDRGSQEKVSSAATDAVIDVNDAPLLGNNNLTVSQGQTVTLDTTMLSATDVDNTAAELTFTVSAVSNGYFAYAADTAAAITSFTLDDIINFPVVFIHDGGEIAPAYDVSLSDGTFSTATSPATVTFTGTVNGILWLSTDGNEGTGNEVPGLDTIGWEKGDILQQADPGFALGQVATNGTFSIAFDISNFGTDANINGIHYVTSEVIIGSGINEITLQAGDLLLTTENDKSFFSNGASPEAQLDVLKEDIFYFRPDKLGDYSVGNFYSLLTDPVQDNSEILGITLIEKDVWVGDCWLSKGDILFSRSGGAEDNDIWLLKTDTLDPQDGGTYPLAQKLIEGDDVGVDIEDKIYGLDILEEDTIIGGKNYGSGTILIALDADDSDGMGGTHQVVKKEDIAALTVTQTTLVSGSAQVVATLMFDGDDVSDSDVNFDTGNEAIDGFTLTVDVSAANIAPTITTIADQTIAEDGSTGTLAFSVGDVDTATGSLIVAASSSNTAIIPNDNLALVPLGSGNWTIDASPAPNQYGGPVTITVTVDDGTTTTDETFKITVSPVNDVPTLTTSASNPTFTEGGAAASLFSGTSVGTIESGQTLSGLTITVTNVSDGANEKLNVDGSSIVLTDGKSGTTESNSLSFSVSLSGGMATITLTGGTLSTAATQLLVDALSYQYDSNDPTTISRVVTLTELVDSGGTANGGDNIATLSAASTVTVIAVDDPPVLTANSALSVPEEATRTITSTYLTVTDFDNVPSEIVFTLTQLPGGTGTVRLNGSTLGLGGTFTQEDIDNNKVTFSSGDDASVTNFKFTVSDGNTTLPEITFSINGVEINDEPSLVTIGSNPIFTEGGAAASLFSGTSVSTIEIGQTLGALSLTVTNVVDGGNEILNIDGNQIALTDGTSGTTSLNGLLFNVSTTDSTATVFLSGGTLTTAEVEALVDSLSYQHNSENPTAGGRTVTLTSLVDSGGKANGGDDTATLSAASTVTVQEINDAPTTTLVTLTAMAEDSGARTITQVELLANAGDTEGDSLTATGLIISGGNGSLADNGDGSWDYTPAANDDTTVSFSYTITDGTDSVVATACLDITPVNDAPTTTLVTLTAMAEDSGARTITQVELLANAGDTEGDSLTATGLIISGGNGSLADNGDGSWDYTPAADDDTTVSFSYTITDGTDSVVATASLDITPVNDAPTTTLVTLTAMAEDSGARTITQVELLANAGDTEGDSLTATGLIISGGNGSLADNGDGSWDYTPAADDDTAVSFSYTITDGTDSVVGTASLDITPVNDAPTTTLVTLTAMAEDSGARTITQVELLANAGDTEGDSLTATGLIISGGNGSLADNGDGSWDYTPAADDDTAVSFSYTITDGTDSVVGTASLDITPVNDAPTTTLVTLAAMAEDSGARTITQVELLANAGDTEGDSLTATGLIISGGNGSLADNGDGSWDYTPAADDDTTVSFSYTITDGTDSVVGTASLDITPVNDAPSITGTVAGSVTEDGTLTDGAALTITDADTADNPISFDDVTTSSGDNNYGDFVMSGNSWTYTLDNNNADVQALDAGQTLTDRYTFWASDATTSQTVTVTINGAEDAPGLDNTIADQSATEDLLFGFTFAANTFSDLDSADNLIYTATLADDSPLPSWLGFVGITRTFSGTPTNSDGTINVKVTADDGTSTVSDIFTISVNNTPTAIDDTAETTPNSPFTTGNVFDNDDLGDAPTTLLSFDATSGSGGTIVYNNDGTFTYTPAAGFTGDDSFTYTITDSDGDTSSATVTIMVKPLADIPAGAGEAIEPEFSQPDSPKVPDIPLQVQSPALSPIVSETYGEQAATDADDMDEATTTTDNSNEEDTSSQPIINTAPSSAADFKIDLMLKQADISTLSLQDLNQLEQAIRSVENEVIRHDLQSEINEVLDLIYQKRSLLETQMLKNSLDSLRDETAREERFEKTIIGSAIAATTSLSAGYVIWLIRSGVLLSSLLSSMPAWQLTDPMAILTSKNRNDEDDPDDSLESIIESGGQKSNTPSAENPVE